MNDTQIKINDYIFKLFISEEKIRSVVDNLASRINKDYYDKSPIFIVVLKGAIFFAVDLLKRIEFNAEIQTIWAKSYGNSMTSSGDVQITHQNLDIKNKDVIIIEDIIDTGHTLNSLIKRLKMMEPKSIETAVFLSKPDQRQAEVPVKYLGLEIPSDFVIGYGLDYAEYGRNLPSIYSLKNK
jgi:hypoxanthine phosphoribosyltransferase